jgi:hypothetical protein
MSDFRSDPTEPEPASEPTSASEHDRSEPESTTARWKHQVEAEARSRLKKHIRNLGSERRG